MADRIERDLDDAGIVEGNTNLIAEGVPRFADEARMRLGL